MHIFGGSKPTIMTYRLKVSLPNIKGFSREYLLNDTNTLYSFHKQMTMDMSFPQDQMVLFKAFDGEDHLVARYATFDLGQGSIEHISIRHLVAENIKSMVYFYDTTNKLSVIITIVGEDSVKVQHPTLVFEKGPLPQAFLNGYVAFEDLPPEKQKAVSTEDFGDDDDEDEDTDEEEDDVEEEEEGGVDDDDLGRF